MSACEKAGIEPLIAMGRQPHHPPLTERFETAPPAPESDAGRGDGASAEDAEGRKVYALRKQTPEPVFGVVDAVLDSVNFRCAGSARCAASGTSAWPE